MRLRWFLWFCFLGLLILLILTWPKNEIRLVFCDVGQGDGAVLVRRDFQMLFDVGPDNGKMIECLSRQMPFWDKKLEAVVLSHMDSDHSGGLAGLKKYFKIDKIYSNEQNSYSKKLDAFDMFRSDWFDFEVLSSGSSDYAQDNDRSVVGVLRLSEKSILFTGDAGVEVEQRLVWRGILGNKINILKVSHHGSNTGTSEELLEAVKPDLAVISVGKNNYGHPTEEVLGRLKKYGVEVWRTDEKGEVVVKFGK